MPDRRQPGTRDRRSMLLTALGVAYTVLAVAALSRSGYQLAAGVASGRAAVAVALSALSGVVYVVAAVGLRRGTPGSLRVGRWCLMLELSGVLLVSAAEPVVGGFGRSTVWSVLGEGYGFAPLVLPVLGLWLLWSPSSVELGRPVAPAGVGSGSENGPAAHTGV